MRRAVVSMLVAATAAAVLSCGAAKPQQRSAFVVQDQKKNEIRDYFMLIREWRAEIGLPGVQPRYALIQKYWNVDIHSLRQKLAKMCELPAEPTDTCNDVCNIAENICENAEAICRIADELENDRWADEKCASAKASCKEAKETCCDCEAKNGNGHGDSAG